jgi:hypothetical protein
MPDKKLTDTEIVKALECCVKAKTNADCEKLKCPFWIKKIGMCRYVNCEQVLYGNALDLINRLQAENEELIYKLECLLCHATGGKLSKHTYPLDTMESCVNDTIQDYCDEAIEEAKAEAYKECIEKVKEKSKKSEIVCSGALVTTSYLISAKNLNNLLKELVGE